VQGSGPVDKEIKHADRQSLIPWRPKVWLAPDLIRNVAAIAKVHPDGLLNAAIGGMLMNTWKQYTINPSVAGNMQSNLENGWKNVFR
jgi:alpha-galactosidase